MRWYAELGLRSLKDVTRMGVVRGRTPEMVRKEVGAPTGRQPDPYGDGAGSAGARAAFGLFARLLCRRLQVLHVVNVNLPEAFGARPLRHGARVDAGDVQLARRAVAHRLERRHANAVARLEAEIRV